MRAPSRPPAEPTTETEGDDRISGQQDTVDEAQRTIQEEMRETAEVDSTRRASARMRRVNAPAPRKPAV
jgi:hypothetical protein